VAEDFEEFDAEDNELLDEGSEDEDVMDVVGTHQLSPLARLQ
jgi:hypothetical protein